MRRFLYIPIFLFVTTVTAMYVFFAFTQTSTAKDQSLDDSTAQAMQLFATSFEAIKKQYVVEPSPEELIHSAINGMLSSLDPHSGFLAEKDFQELKESTKGSFGGLGIEVTLEKGLVKVISPIEDTPAAKAGILSGDYIIQIDNTNVNGMSLREAVKRMKGEKGTKVSLTISRKEEKPFKVIIERAEIQITVVKSNMFNDLAYLRIAAFNQNTTPHLHKHVADIYKKNPNIQGFLVDLRNNPGGLLSEAISVSDSFLEKGEIVSIQPRSKDEIRRFFAQKGDISNQLPIVVLINQGSASASEIVAGALRDNNRAIIVGEKSFGKGSVQTIIPVSETSAVRMTTAIYYTPSNTSIQGRGIDPDVNIPVLTLEEKENNKINFSEVNNVNAIDNNTEQKSESKIPRFHDFKELKNDYQLARAIDILYSLSTYNKGQFSIVK